MTYDGGDIEYGQDAENENQHAYDGIEISDESEDNEKTA